MIGYVQLYFKVIGENDTYYAMFNGDFGKPLSFLRLLSIKRSFKHVYKKFDKIRSVEFCTKEEYEKEKGYFEIEMKWGGDEQ